MKKIVVCIPIKLNSKRLKNKNIKPFYNGKNILQIMLQTLVKVDRISDIYVFCSDESIKEYLLPEIKFLKRSEKLDKDNATPQMIIDEFMSMVDADIYGFCHATSPFIKVESLNKCIDNVLNGEYDSAFSAKKLLNLLWCNNEPLNFDASNIPRTQDLVPIYSEVSAAYFFKKETFISLQRRIGIKPYICELDAIESIDIDEEIDFKIANAIYRSREFD